LKITPGATALLTFSVIFITSTKAGFTRFAMAGYRHLRQLRHEPTNRSDRKGYSCLPARPWPGLNHSPGGNSLARADDGAMG